MVDELLAAARRLEKRALGKLVTLLEGELEEGASARRAATAALDELACGVVIGITGAPGVGKSTLVAALAQKLLDGDEQRRVAVVAVDPSSQLSGGSVLGDRARFHVRVPGAESRFFFRSQASELELGGLSPRTFQVVRALRRLFDFVFVETVGVGQSEVDVCRLADTTALLLGPQAGDEIQFMKAGLIELPELVVAAKVDLGDKMTLAKLRSAIPPDKLLGTSAVDGSGLAELSERILAVAPADSEKLREVERYFLRRWVLRHYGQSGLAFWASWSGAAACDYDTGVATFRDAYRAWLGA